MRSARSWECSLATITSWSPLATSTGIVTVLRSCGLCIPAATIARSWATIAWGLIDATRSAGVRSCSRAR